MVLITGWVADSAAALECGTIEFTQAQRIDNGELMITQSVAVAQVTRGELRTLNGQPFSLPANPEGTAVRVLERFGGRTFEWWTAVPEGDSVEYRLLPIVESSCVPESVWGPPPWIAQVEAMRDETIQKIEEGVEVAEALGGLPGIQDKLAQAEASATAAAASEAAAGQSAATAATSQTAAQNAAGAAAVSSETAQTAATAAAASASAADGSAAAAAGSALGASSSAATASTKAGEATSAATAAEAAKNAAAASAGAAATSATAASGSAASAATDAARAEAAADGIDMSAINQRLDGMDSSLGAKLDKSSEASKLYGTDDAGAQVMHAIASPVTPNAVAVRDASGQLLVPTAPTAAQHAASKSYVDARVKLVRDDFDLLQKESALIQDLTMTTKIELTQDNLRVITKTHECTLLVAPQDMFIRSVAFSFDNDVYVTGAANAATFRILHRLDEDASAVDVVRLSTAQQQLNRRNTAGGAQMRRRPWSMQNGAWGNDAARTVKAGNYLSWHLGAIVGNISIALPVAITIEWSPVR